VDGVGRRVHGGERTDGAPAEWHRFRPVPRPSPTAAARDLARRDPVMARLVAQAGPPRIRPPQRTAFEALARAICFQQLSGKAAATIYGRFVALCTGTDAGAGAPLEPEAVLATPIEELRRAGLSAAKAASVHDLAAKVVDGTVPLDRVGRLSDEELIDRLVVVRGIGRWTAEMFLIFQLRRLDVWPVDDLGVRKGYARAHGLGEAPPPKELQVLGEAYRPYRSIAAWYFWRALDVTLPAD
jgi:DNA-3-methyladenine glycosylase II